MPHNLRTQFGDRPIPNEAEVWRYLQQLGYQTLLRKQEFFVAFLGRRWAPEWPLMIHERVRVWDWCEEAWKRAQATGEQQWPGPDASLHQRREL